MTWKEFIAQEKQEPYFKVLTDFVMEDAKMHTIYPPHKDVFNAFKHTPLDRVKAVILAQDPYANPNEAMGMCFSVPKTTKITPSLRNIFKELKADLGLEPPNHGDLSYWASQGVFLLNSVLTVREKDSASHRGKGWEVFTDKAIKLVNEQDRPIVYMLWGSFAKSKRPLITNPKHLILTANHPSPLSAHTGWFGTRHFSKANEFLAANGEEMIDWSLD